MDRGMAVPRFFIFSQLDYYNTIVLYSVFREYSDAQSLPNQLAKVCAMARQRRDFLFSHGWIITILQYYTAYFVNILMHSHCPISLPTMARQRRHFLFSHGWIITIL